MKGSICIKYPIVPSVSLWVLISRLPDFPGLVWFGLFKHYRKVSQEFLQQSKNIFFWKSQTNPEYLFMTYLNVLSYILNCILTLQQTGSLSPPFVLIFPKKISVFVSDHAQYSCNWLLNKTLHPNTNSTDPKCYWGN